MRKIFILLFVTTGLFTQASATTVKEFLPKADAFLKMHVKNGAVAYKVINQKPAESEALYRLIGETSLSGASDNEKKAFYINAYNIIVIYWAAKYYPLKSPLDRSGFFDKVKHIVAGEEMTLNALEIKKLLLPYKDGRFHFVLACAAKSCPPLASFAYMPEKLDQQLTERSTAALNNPEWIRVDKTKSSVGLSKIFEWYKGDFIEGGKSPIEWVNKFRKEKIPPTFSITYYEYDWSLNEL